jgi:hypothetical protein
MSKRNQVQVVESTEQVESNQVETTKVETKEEILARFGNKSKAIRGLTNEGMSRSQIAKVLDIRYQHVRNVLVSPLKTTETK